MRPLLFASPFLVLSLVSAQGFVSPHQLWYTEANSQNRFPFGEFPAQVFRYLQVHDDLRGTPRPIRTMYWRRTGGTCGTVCTQPHPAYSVTLDAWCSTATTTASTLLPAFASNHGNDKLQVVTNKTFNFPASVIGPTPSPFVYQVTFDVPFIYIGTGSLCWEVQVTARTNTLALYHDACSGSSDANPALGTESFGVGCKATGQAATLGAAGSSTMSWQSGTGNVIVDGTSAPANGVIVLLLGFRNDSFGGIPLPFLVPGTSTAPSGPCNLYTSLAFVIAGLATASGTSTTTIPIPATRDLDGGSTFAQIIAFDSAANPSGIVLSNGVRHYFVAPYTTLPVGRVYLSGNLGASGSAEFNGGLVTRFDL